MDGISEIPKPDRRIMNRGSPERLSKLQREILDWCKENVFPGRSFENWSFSIRDIIYGLIKAKHPTTPGPYPDYLDPEWRADGVKCQTLRKKVHRSVRNLEKKGFVKCVKYKGSRSLEIEVLNVEYNELQNER